MTYDKKKNYNKHNSFQENLLLGKIAEQIVESIFSESDVPIFRYGYENFLPQLQGNHNLEGNLVDEIKSQSDFIFIDEEKRLHYLEVKYRKNKKSLKSLIQDIQEDDLYPEFVIGITKKRIYAIDFSQKYPELKNLTQYPEFKNISKKIILKYLDYVKKIYKDL